MAIERHITTVLTRQPTPRVADVIRATAEHFNTPVEVLTSPTRKQPITRRRQVGMFVARKVTGRSLPFIARKFGRKDHTTVLHAVRVVEAKLAEGKFTKAVAAITAQVTGGAE